MKLLVSLIQQLIQDPDNPVLEILISQYTDTEINDACCLIRSGVRV